MSASGDETRDRLVRIIQGQPGISKSRLKREAGLAWGTISHHLRILQRAGQIDLFHMGRSARIVPRKFARDLERQTAVMAPLARDILRGIANLGPKGPAALARETGSTARRVQGQLDYLVEAGLIERDESYHARYGLSASGQSTVQRMSQQTDATQTPDEASSPAAQSHVLSEHD